jgi:hypothetical protein
MGYNGLYYSEHALGNADFPLFMEPPPGGSLCCGLHRYIILMISWFISLI